MSKTYFILVVIAIHLCLLSASAWGTTATIQPVNLPDYDLPDLLEASISDSGSIFLRSNLGGEFRSYNVTGNSSAIVNDFQRNPKIGQYYIRPFFTPHERWTVLNSALGSPEFDGKAHLDVVNSQGKIAFSVDASAYPVGGSMWPSIFDFSPDENLLAFAQDSNTIVLHNLMSGKEDTIVLDKNNLAPTDITFHPNGKVLATKSAVQGDITLWDIESKKRIALYNDPEEGDIGDFNWYDDKTVYFSRDGKYVASSSTLRNSFFLWDAVSGNLLRRGNASQRNQIRVSPQNKFIAFGNQIFDQRTMAFRTLKISDDYYLSVAFSYDDRLIALGRQGKLFVFETESFSQVALIELLDDSSISKIAFSDNNHFYVLHDSGRLYYVTLN